MKRSKRKLTRKDLIEAFKEARDDMEDPPEILILFLIPVVLAIVIAGIKGCF